MITESEALECLQAGQISLGPLQVERIAKISPAPNKTRVDLQWRDQRFGFVVDYVRVATPKNIEAVAAQLQRYVTRQSAVFPLILAPYLSPQLLNRLLEENISAIDLSGNYGIVVPGHWFIVHDSEPNKHPAQTPIRNVYRGASSLVARTLALVPEFSTARELQEEIGRRNGSITKGTISKVLKVLEDDLLISRKDSIRVLRPGVLLDRLRDNYSVKPTGRTSIKLPDTIPVVAMRQAAERQEIAIIGRNEDLYAIGPRSNSVNQFYVSSIDRLLGDLAIDPVARFGNVELIKVNDPEVYFDPREHEGMLWCSPLQIYLELARGGKRERESADELRTDLLAYRI